MAFRAQPVSGSYSRISTLHPDTDLVCYGLTAWDFRPLVQQSPAISWTLLQTLAKRLRAAQED